MQPPILRSRFLRFAAALALPLACLPTAACGGTGSQTERDSTAVGGSAGTAGEGGSSGSAGAGGEAGDGGGAGGTSGSGAGGAGPAEDATIYVATTGSDSDPGSLQYPFRTIARAVQEIPYRKNLTDANIVVFIGPGTYFLTESIKIDATSSGSAQQSVTFANLPGQARPVVSGGEELLASDWVGPDSSNVYRYELEGKDSFRQLYAGERKLTRARQPNVQPWQGDLAPTLSWLENEFHQISFANLDTNGLPLLTNGMNVGFPDASIADLVIPVGWGMSRLRVLSWVASGTTVYLSPNAYEGSMETQKAHGWGPFHAGTQRFFFEGHPAFVDSDGEWAIDVGSQQLLLASSDPSVLTHTVIPRLSTLVEMSGAAYVTFRGIQFSHASYTDPDTYGFVTGSGFCTYRWGTDANGNAELAPCTDTLLPAAIEISQSEHIRVTDSVLSQLGAIAIRAEGGDHVAVDESFFSDVASSGILTWGTSDVTIRKNTADSVGFDYGADVVDIVGGERIAITHNAVEYVAGRAFYVVSGNMFDDATPADNVTISDNTVSNALNMLTDAGAINTGGSGMLITNNSIDAVWNRGWNNGAGTVQALYLDIGSYRMTATGNDIDDVQVGVRFNCQGNNQYYANTLGTTHLQRVAVTFAGACTSFLSGTAKDYMTGLMSQAGCTNIGAAGEYCGCNDAGTCATDSYIVDGAP